MKKGMTRRDFLRVAGLTIAVAVTPDGIRLFSAAEAAEAADFSPNAWLRIAPDGAVTVVVNKSEMGQGTHTGLTMVVADELDADWNRVRMEMAPAADAYKDPVWGSQATGGSSSVRHMVMPLRKAGAAARGMLVAAAAKEWNVPAGECETASGVVKHTKSGRGASYGELAVKASSMAVQKEPALKKEGQFRLMGTAMKRLDSAAKVAGTAAFGIDTFIPMMLYGTIARPLAYGSKAVSYDEAAARKVPGVEAVVNLPRGIGVCASTIEAAWQGKNALKIVWGRGNATGITNVRLRKAFTHHLAERPPVVARKDGDAKKVLGEAPKKVTAEFFLPYLAHATMEPMNCTAHVQKDRCDLWVPTQNQTGAVHTAAAAAGLRPEQVFVHTTYLGGGFGRRFEQDFVEEAVGLSKAAGRPVKLIWTREEDLAHDWYRPGNCCRIEGAVDGKGRITAWFHRVVCPSIFSRVFPNMVKKGVDPAAVEGIENMEYEIPNVHVEYVQIDAPAPVGFWRSVGSSHNAFTVECFIDELARAAGKDPLEFRLSHLQNHKRAARVLETAAKMAGWGKKLHHGITQGIAQHMSFDSHVAQVAEVSVDAKTGEVRVHKVYCAVDCGSVINPDAVKAQMMGGIMMGLSAALKEQVIFTEGTVTSNNFDSYEILRMDEAPDVEVQIIALGSPTGGIGEPGVPPIAPAVANAFFAATGKRIYNLPMTKEAVKKVLQA